MATFIAAIFGGVTIQHRHSLEEGLANLFAKWKRR